MNITRSPSCTGRMVLHRVPPAGRKDRNCQGEPALNSSSRKSEKREREPWMLIASLELRLSVRPAVTRHARRMQIELSLRVLKSQRYGQGFKDSLTRVRAQGSASVAQPRSVGPISTAAPLLANQFWWRDQIRYLFTHLPMEREYNRAFPVA